MKRAACLIALLLLALPAKAQVAERPGVKAGDQWKFVVYYATPSTAPNRIWVIDWVGRDRIEGRENGEPLSLTPELNVLESPRHTESAPRALSFPLHVGKRWRYASEWLFKPKGSKGSTTVEVVVAAHEKVNVPAGELDAFKLVAKGELYGMSGVGSRIAGETTATYWYAPAARAIARSVTHNPYLGTTTVELVEFSLQP